ncbi:MAG TPA: hypothetical protein PL193_15185 [Xanthobacteraceae bacterium]|nr:hypothetical protein [Xanthobacteraceae bacterium]
MTREFAAITFFAFFTGAALAGPIESSALTPPAPIPDAAKPLDDAQLRGLIEDALKDERKQRTAQIPAPAAQQAAKAELPAAAPEDWNAYSSAELWLEGIPEASGLSLDIIARRNRLNPAYASVQRELRSLPTSYEWNNGNWKANFGANVSTSTGTTVIPSPHYAGAISSSSGSGEFKGRVEYDYNAWQFYGGTQRSVIANADGTISLNNNFLGGTYYNLPNSLLGGKVGTGFEVNPLGDAKTRLEYRQMFGNTEGFIAAERITPFQHTDPDATGANALKAGLNRKF